MFGSKGKKGTQTILRHTPYLGSARNRVIHSTDNPCSEAYLIEPDDRWYVKSIPQGGGYNKCPKCFPVSKEKQSQALDD